MEDMERYGDYNECDEEPGKNGSLMSKILKIGVAAVCLLVSGVLLFRIVMFDHLPREVSALTFNEKLTAYYRATDGEIGVRTQKLRFPYDDHARGNFFCDGLAVISGAEQLQIIVRYNRSAMEDIEKRYGLKDLDADDPTLLTFRFSDNVGYESEDTPGRQYTDVQVSATAKKSVYRYVRLTADGIDFEGKRGEKPAWIRLDIYVKGATDDKPYSSVLVYENHKENSSFSEYRLSGKERPQ